MRHRREAETSIDDRTRHAGANGAQAAGKSATDHPAAGKNSHSAADEPKQPKGNFFEKLRQMSTDDWDRHRVYVYRRWPQISKDASPHYLAVHREAVDEEFIKA